MQPNENSIKVFVNELDCDIIAPCTAASKAAHTLTRNASSSLPQSSAARHRLTHGTAGGGGQGPRAVTATTTTRTTQDDSVSRCAWHSTDFHYRTVPRLYSRALGESFTTDATSSPLLPPVVTCDDALSHGWAAAAAAQEKRPASTCSCNALLLLPT